VSEEKLHVGSVTEASSGLGRDIEVGLEVALEVGPDPKKLMVLKEVFGGEDFDLFRHDGSSHQRLASTE
jgi:hypothetical protein